MLPAIGVLAVRATACSRPSDLLGAADCRVVAVQTAQFVMQAK